MNKWAGILALSAVVGTNACTLKVDDAERFRDPIPQGSDVAMGIPGSSSGTTQAKSLPGSSLHLSDVPAGGATTYAKFYQVTRDLADGVDLGTAWVLGLVWEIVHLPPTSVAPQQAVWGPGNGDALSPVVWRFTVHEVGDKEYDYKLEGRPKGSTSEADYKTVLEGHGWGKERPEHREGSFRLDFDASRALDPARTKDSGNASISFDLRQYPATITANLASTDATRHEQIVVTHQADASGAVDITAHDDVEPVKDGNLEDIVLHSRWDSTGAGRGDGQVSGGDLPASVKSVQVSECWNDAFARVYYTDSANLEPTTGTAAACAFPDAKF